MSKTSVNRYTLASFSPGIYLQMEMALQIQRVSKWGLWADGEPRPLHHSAARTDTKFSLIFGGDKKAEVCCFLITDMAAHSAGADHIESSWQSNIN